MLQPPVWRRTPTEVAFLERGPPHVYFPYCSGFMMNVSSEKPGIGAGVFCVAVEPLEGIALMAHYRGTQRLGPYDRSRAGSWGA